MQCQILHQYALASIMYDYVTKARHGDLADSHAKREQAWEAWMQYQQKYCSSERNVCSCAAEATDAV